MSKIAYITEKASDGVMASFGMDVYRLTKKDSMNNLIVELIRDNYAVVFVSEKVYQANEAIINSYNHDFSITILVLASEINHQNLGQKRLKTLIEDAVGIKVE